MSQPILIEEIQTKEAKLPSGNFDEPGSTIWKLYLDQADKHDKTLVDGWRDDMDTILIFAALFSASVTAFVIQSYPNLQPDMNDISVNILLQISRQLANSTHAGAAVPPPPFQPGPLDVAVNIFWFLSLAFSLVCSLAAVMVRQWARHYLSVPRNLSSTKDRARTREYLFENVELWKIEVVVDTIPALLHISLLLFFIGLLLFLYPINHQVAQSMLCFCTVGIVVYILLTITPIIFPGCPYRTPFSGFLVPVLEVVKKPTVVATTALIAIIAYIAALLALALNRVIQLYSSSKAKSCRNWGHSLLMELRPLPAIMWSPSKVLSNSGDYTLGRIFTPVTWAWRFKCSVQERRLALATNKPIGRDAIALKRMMDFSKQDSDMIAVIEALPDYLRSFIYIQVDGKSYLSRDIYAVQLNFTAAGIDRHLSRFLQSCIEGGVLKVSSGVIISWMEAVNCLTRCPAVFGGPTTWSDFVLFDDESLPVIPFQLDIGHFSTFNITYSFPTGDRADLLIKCTILRLALSRVYQIEKLLKQYIEQRNSSAAIPEQGRTSRAYDWLQGALDEAESAFTRYVPGYAIDMILSLPLTGYNTEMLPKLESLRQRLVFGVIDQFTLKALSEPILFDSLCDAVTHLRPFPASTADSEAAIFRLHNIIQKNGKLPAILHTMCRRVLWGSKHTKEWRRTLGLSGRLDFQSLFFDNVRVHKGPFDPSILDIQISFTDFHDFLCKSAAILDDPSEAELLNKQANMIFEILRLRLRPRGRDETSSDNENPAVDGNQVLLDENQAVAGENHVVIDEKFLAAAQTVLEKSNISQLHKLVYSTVEKSGHLDRIVNN